MNLIVEKHPDTQKQISDYSMIVIGNGPAFLQTVIMLEGRDILPITNNDADFVTLQNVDAYPLKKDFVQASLSMFSEKNIKMILISSTTHTHQLLKIFTSIVHDDQVILVVRQSNMKKKLYKWPYLYYIDTIDQFSGNLWHRGMTLYRLAKMTEYLKSKVPKNQKKLKMLILFFGPPDPDAIASGLAYVKLFSKFVTATFASTAKVKRFENRALLSYLKLKVIDVSTIDTKEFDVIACLDCQPAFFLKSNYDFEFDICIDHHPEDPQNPVIPIMDVKKNFGSCATIIAQFYYYSRKNLPKSIATSLLFGIRSDTVNFTRSAYEVDVNMMTYLYKKVDKKILKAFEFSQVPKRTLKYFKRAYDRYMMEGQFLFCHLGKVGYLDIGSIIAETFLKIQKVHVSVVSCINRDKLIVFFRSVQDDHHAGEIASKIFEGFGVGGGHHDMGRAECFLQELPFLKKDIENQLYDFLKSKLL